MDEKEMTLEAQEPKKRRGGRKPMTPEQKAEAAKECGMPMSTFRYRAAIYEKSTLS